MQPETLTITKRSMNSHHSSAMVTDTWLTPKPIIEALGEFDLDPCTPEIMPWLTAKNRYTKVDCGLRSPWFGRVWLNPPYGREAVKWTQKLADHGNGIALILARTETKDWFDTVWNRADAILFLKGRIYFHDKNGVKAKANCGAAPVLVAYGKNNVEALRFCGIEGKLIEL
jgi:hypothetical protein